VHRALWLDRSNLERTRVAQVDPLQTFRLERMRALLKELGDPHLSVPMVHIAGSKGKGSIAEMSAAALRGCEYTVGLFTSPHLLDLRDRIRVLDAHADASINIEQFATLGRRVLDAGERAASTLEPATGLATGPTTGAATGPAMGPVTSFELLTALAFVFFAEQAVDIGIIEVGVGGLLDATNVITPIACVLSEIQMEHTLLLGNSIEQIAIHKAGIIKAGVPVVSVPQDDRVLKIFDETAQRVGAPLVVLGREVPFTQRLGTCPEVGACHRVSVLLPTRTYEHVPVPMPGEHQAANCAAVLTLLDYLVACGFDLPEGRVVEGLLHTARQGRLEVVHESPRVIVDGAHTPDSVRAVMRTLATHFRPDCVVVVFGCHDDKDVKGMLEAIATGADKIILTKAGGNERAVEPRDLHRKHVEVGTCMALQAPTVKDAINVAAAGMGSNGLILVTGSFGIAGEAKRLFIEKRRATADTCEPRLHEPKIGITPCNPQRTT